MSFCPIGCLWRWCQVRSGARELAQVVGLDDVARLEVLEIGQADAALEPLTALPGIFLEAPQRRDLAMPDHGALAQEAHLRAPRDDARQHVTAGDRTDPRHPEDLAHLGFSGDDLFVDRK